MSLSLAPWRRLDFMAERSFYAGQNQLNLAASPDRGSGEPTILFLHGVLRHWRTFHPLLTALPELARLAALDFRGHGRSQPVPGAYRVRDYVEDALAAVDEVWSPRLILYGHSLGAMVALAVAARIPDQIAAVILEDPPFSTMGPGLGKGSFGRYFQGVRDCLRGPREPEQLHEAFCNIELCHQPDGTPLRVRNVRSEASCHFLSESLATIDPAVLDPVLAGTWLQGFDPFAEAAEIRCPVWLLQADAGAGGMLGDVDATQLITRLSAPSHLVRFAGVGHNLHEARPEELVALVRASLAAHVE